MSRRRVRHSQQGLTRLAILPVRIAQAFRCLSIFHSKSGFCDDSVWLWWGGGEGFTTLCGAFRPRQGAVADGGAEALAMAAADLSTHLTDALLWVAGSAVRAWGLEPAGFKKQDVTGFDFLWLVDSSRLGLSFRVLQGVASTLQLTSEHLWDALTEVGPGAPCPSLACGR